MANAFDWKHPGTFHFDDAAVFLYMRNEARRAGTVLAGGVNPRCYTQFIPLIWLHLDQSFANNY
ncbi:hypothetical protein Mal15_06220 [Stieleria maiorica]|uniref:Uncharacterized protein n=1 Tax=Stieleria maiorica TaxID=2795974 RepID=A0A5B9MAM1_9BACT|nr:hypothetical protein Mal15_06220 [Stieleria maiorica]